MDAFFRLPARNAIWPGSSDTQTNPLQWVALLAPPALAGLLYVAIWVLGGGPIRPYLIGDSASYILFDMERPIGYPVFIWIVKTVFGSYLAVLWAQLALFCVSAAVLGYAVLRLTGSLLPALALELMFIGYPGPIRLYDQIQSDSLATSVAAMFMAAVIFALRTRSIGSFVAVCVTLAVAVTIRPINLVLVVPVLAVAWLSAGGERRPLLGRGALAVAATVLGVLATPALHLAMHGSAASSSPLARGLIQKVMFSPDVVSSPSESCDAPFINQQMAPVVDHIEAAPSATTGWLLKRYGYTEYLRWMVIIPGLMERHGVQTQHEVDPILLCYTLDAARRFPQAAATGIWEEYWNLIGNAPLVTASEKKEFDDYVAAHPPPPITGYNIYQGSSWLEMRNKMIGAGINADEMDDDLIDVGFKFRSIKAYPSVLIIGLKLVQYGAWALSALAIVAVMFGRVRRSEFGLPLSVIAVAGLAYHLTVAGTAVVEMALPRYVFVVWPQITTIWIVAAVLVFDQMLKARRHYAPRRY